MGSVSRVTLFVQGARRPLLLWVVFSSRTCAVWTTDRREHGFMGIEDSAKYIRELYFRRKCLSKTSVTSEEVEGYYWQGQTALVVGESLNP